MLARYNSVNKQAQDVASTPFRPYSQDPSAFVQPLTGTQQSAIGNIDAAQTTAQPYYDAATGMTAMGSQATPGLIPQYMSPYLSSVVGTTMANLGQEQATERSTFMGDAAMNGAFGGDRAGIGLANLDRQQGMATGSVLSNILNQGYNTAAGLAQGDLNRYLQAGQQFAGLGTGLEQTQLQGAQAQLGAGTLEQQTGQAGKSALYNQYLQQQGYPFQVAQFLANIAEGTGALSGSTTTTQQPVPFFSDARLKRNIEEVGKLYDGQPIYRYDMNGGKQLGLIAQDVEKRHPDAVGSSHGYRTVEYGRATDDAAERGHFAGGGAPGLVGGNDIGQILASQRQSFAPFSDAGLYGGSGTGAGLVGKRGWVPEAKLPVPGLMTAGPPPKPQQSTVSQLADTADTVKRLWDTGKGVAKEFSQPAAQAPAPAADGTQPINEDDLNRALPPGPFARGGLVPRRGFASGGLGDVPQFGDPTEKPDDPMSARPLEAQTMGASYFPEDVLKTSAPKTLPKPDTPAAPQSTMSGINSALGLASTVLGIFGLKDGGAVRGGYASGGSPASDMDHWKRAISGIESGGNYQELGPVIPKTGDRAWGKYQVMGANIPEWTQAALGHRMTPREFLADPEAQEKVFEHQFGSYVQKYGSPEGAASAWFTGRPRTAQSMASNDGYISGQTYVDRFARSLGTGTNGPATARSFAYAPTPGLAPAAVAANSVGASGRGLVPSAANANRPGLSPARYSPPNTPRGQSEANQLMNELGWRDVAHFQASMGLEPDGIVGSKTLGALKDVLGKTQATLDTLGLPHNTAGIRVAQARLGTLTDGTVGPKTLGAFDNWRRVSDPNGGMFSQAPVGGLALPPQSSPAIEAKQAAPPISVTAVDPETGAPNGTPPSGINLDGSARAGDDGIPTFNVPSAADVASGKAQPLIIGRQPDAPPSTRGLNIYGQPTATNQETAAALNGGLLGDAVSLAKSQFASPTATAATPPASTVEKSRDMVPAPSGAGAPPMSLFNALDIARSAIGAKKADEATGSTSEDIGNKLDAMFSNNQTEDQSAVPFTPGTIAYPGRAPQMSNHDAAALIGPHGVPTLQTPPPQADVRPTPHYDGDGNVFYPGDAGYARGGLVPRRGFDAGGDATDDPGAILLPQSLTQPMIYGAPTVDNSGKALKNIGSAAKRALSTTSEGIGIGANPADKKPGLVPDRPTDDVVKQRLDAMVPPAAAQPAAVAAPPVSAEPTITAPPVAEAPAPAPAPVASPSEPAPVAASTPAPGDGAISAALQRTAPKNVFQRGADFVKDNENWLVPVLSGLKGMAQSKSLYAGSAALEGLGTAAESYMDVQAQQAEIAAEQAGVTGKQLENIKGSIFNLPLKDGGDVPMVVLADGRVVSLTDWQNSGNPPTMGNTSQAQKIIQDTLAAGSNNQTVTAVKAPQAPALPSINGVGFSQDTADQAKKDAALTRSGLPGAGNYSDVSRNYLGQVTTQYHNAVAPSGRLTDLQFLDQSASQADKGFNVPGAYSAPRASIIRAADTVARGLGLGDNYFSGNDKQSLPSQKDLFDKLTAMSTSGLDPKSVDDLYNRLHQLPTLEMSPETQADVIATRMVQGQRAIDAKSHLDTYGRYSGGIYANAEAAYRRDNPDAKYRDEQIKLANLIAWHPAIAKFLSDANIPVEKKLAILSRSPELRGDKSLGDVSGLARYFAG